MELKLRTWGEGPVPVLWLHGFAGDGGSFDGLRDDLSSSVRATLPDLPGHGATKGPAAAGTGWEETLAALEAVLRALPGPRLLAGYSMGARLALALALRSIFFRQPVHQPMMGLTHVMLLLWERLAGSRPISHSLKTLPGPNAHCC